MASKRQVVALDLGSSVIEAVLGQYKDGRLRVSKAATYEMPKGCYEGGVVQDSYELGNAIKKAVSKLGARTKDVIISYESGEVIKRELVVQKVDEEDMQDLVAYEITNYLPIDIANYVLQHKVLREAEEVGKVVVLAMAVPVDVANSIFDVVKSAGLNPVGMVLSSVCLEYFFDSPDENIAAIDIGSKHTNVAIITGGTYEFDRLLNTGFSIFDSALQKYSTEDTVENLRRRVKIARIWEDYRYGTLASEEIDSEERAVIEEIVLMMDNFLDEIEKVVQFYLKRDANNRLDKIYLYGGGSLLDDMDAVIERKLGITTEIVDLPELEDIPNYPVYLNAAAAMTSGNNFFHPFIKEKPKTNLGRLFAAIAAVLLVAVLIVITATLLFKEAALKTSIDDLNAEINSRQMVEGLERVDRLEQIHQKLSNTEARLIVAQDQFNQANTMSDDLVNLINAQIPDKVFLSGIDVSGNSVSLTGFSGDHQNISQFVYNLRNTGKFENINLGTISSEDGNFGFNITFDIVEQTEVGKEKGE